MSKRSERWASDYGWLREIVQEHARQADTRKQPLTEKPVVSALDDRPTFDAASWKPTAKVLEMLGKVRIVTEQQRREEVAAANEAKYGDGAPTYADRMIDKFTNTHGRNYSAIEAMAGHNGDCHSRKTTYRRFKFGKGSISRKGYLAQGFEENRRTAQ